MWREKTVGTPGPESQVESVSELPVMLSREL